MTMLDRLRHLTAACRRLTADDRADMAALAGGIVLLGLVVFAAVWILAAGTGVLP